MAMGGKGPDGDFGASPQGGYAMPPGGAPKWAPGDAVSYGWSKVKADPVGIVLPIFVIFLVNFIPNSVFNAIAGSLQRDGNVGASLGVQLLGMVVNLAISSFLMGGLLTFLFKIIRGQSYAIGDVFSGGPYFGPMFLTQLLMQLGVGIGMLLCIVPGVILALGWALSLPLVVDRQLGGVDALKESWRLTTGQKMDLFVLWLLGILVTLAGVIACCVGVFPAMSVMAVAYVYAYCRITDQPIKG
jgi:uncharacterized membrane protein